MILEKIAASTRKRVEVRKKEVPFEKIKAQAEAMEKNTGYPFYRALAQEDMSFICEVKKASPSKGIIAEKFPYLEIAREYEEAGASAISCLTEPEFFLGKDQYLKEIAGEVSIPVLRKDFVVDSYQIYEAKTLGASAVLLICTLLGEENLKEYLKITRALGMTALTEAHDEEEIRQALRAGADVIGVNNRNLKNFTVDVENSLRLRRYIPEGILFVAESGIHSPEDISRMREAGVDAVLIGEALMKSENKKKMLNWLKKGDTSDQG